MLVLAIGALLPTLGSCGSMRSYWGVEGSYDFADGFAGRPAPPRHGHKKPHKPKKPHKAKKHHKKHHHDDD